jgi:hypothetical protein
MEAIHIASTPAELYNAVLVDTPIGKWIWRACNIDVITVIGWSFCNGFNLAFYSGKLHSWLSY